MIQNIMVAVDGSDNNKVAVDYAIDLAKRYGAKLTAVTVFDAAKNEGMNYQKELVQETNDKNLAYAVAKASEMGYPLSTVSPSEIQHTACWRYPRTMISSSAEISAAADSPG